ncbi:spore germination lipoprotein GerD [Ureibacillus acetophenoni]|uniref:Spore germination protein D n=1 Tax=Ureibacillus acetophenoni TaxID=614649 RepID=A0A285UAR5_9BACL|nr:spore germination lipoprotein GerD [Ureibacillus acetophenoni]SOC39014.1 spore germination protein D [Ureibacillus acetophenoni]
MLKRLLILSVVLLFLASCSDTPTQTMSYDEIKKIMIDSIQTEDGKKALRQMLEDPSIRDLIILEHDQVETAIKDTLLSEEATEFWKKQFEDPKFKESIAKSMKEQQTDIMKDLIKNATFQEDLVKFFGQPDMQKQLETILKSSTLRKQMEEVVMQTIEDPLLQTKWQELIRKSGEGASKSGGKEGGGEGGGEGGSGGGQGEGEGGGSSS